MKCSNCNAENLVFERTEGPYADSPGIVVDGIEYATCWDCGTTTRRVPRLKELHELVITTALGKPWRLAPAEIRWLRLAMHMKAEDLAKTLGVTASQMSRWETGAAPISALADRLLRMIVADWHHVPAPNLAAIDGSHAEPLKVRIALSSKWKLAAAGKQRVA